MCELSPAEGRAQLINSEAELICDQMKCIGSDNPPCARCAKSGRECIVQRSGRANPTSGTNTPSSHVRVNEASSYSRPSASRQSVGEGSRAQPELLGARPHHSFSPINSNILGANESALPSIYTTPPYSTVFNQADGSPNQISEDLDSHRSWKRRRIGPASQSPLSLTPADPSTNPISERDIIQYVEM